VQIPTVILVLVIIVHHVAQDVHLSIPSLTQPVLNALQATTLMQMLPLAFPVQITAFYAPQQPSAPTALLATASQIMEVAMLVVLSV